MRLAVYKPDGKTLIAFLPRRRGVQWLDEVNGPGTGKFEIHQDDPVLAAHPTLLDSYNIVKIFVDDAPVKAWQIEDVSPVRVADPVDLWISVSGRGLLSLLETAVVYPEYGVREYISEDRNFNFASKDGTWRKPEEWTNTFGIAWKDDPYAGRAGLPKTWTDPTAQWLWSSAPGNHPLGKNWFRTTFRVDAPTQVIIYATADNDFSAYLDGEMIMTNGGNAVAFKQRYEWLVTLSTGDHTFAAVVENTSGLTAPSSNPAGWIFSIVKAGASGEPTDTVLVNSQPSNTIVKPYGDAPGWTGAMILQQCIVEAQERGVSALVPVTFDFSAHADSSGIAWGDVQERSTKVGTTDLWDLTMQLVELTMDVNINPNFVLSAWKKRGTDRSSTIRLMPNRDLMSGTATVRSSKLRNHTLTKFEGGWIELYSGESREEFGRREVGISLGTAKTYDQAVLTGTQVMQEIAQPEETLPITYTSARGAQPYTDFELGDTIMVPDTFKGMRRGRLMSISGSERDDGGIDWDLDFYPDEGDDTISHIKPPSSGSFNDVSSLYESEVLSDSPWAYWRLTESASPMADKSGNLRSLTITGEPLYDQSGPVSRAMLFSHLLDQYGTSPAGSLFKFENATVEVWVRVELFQASNEGRVTLLGMVGSTGFGAAQHDKELGINPDGTVYFYVVQDGVQYTVTSATKLQTEVWYHLVGSVGASGMRLYVNGTVATKNTAVKGSYSDAGQRVILRGGGSGYNSQRARVILAEPAVYFQQLLDSRIKNHYDVAKSSTAVESNGPITAPSATYTAPTPSETKSTAYNDVVMADMPWLFYRYETINPTVGVLDSSGNSRNGTPHGSFTTDLAGPVSKAVQFSQLAAQYVATADNDRFDSSGATLETWVNVGQLPTGPAPIIGMAVEYGGTVHDKTLGINADGTLFFYVQRNGDKTLTTGSTITLTTGRWYHIAARVGSRGQCIFIDGNLVAENTTVTGSYDGTPQRVLVRGSGDDYTSRVLVDIAESAVYTMQISQTRLRAHYDAGKT